MSFWDKIFGNGDKAKKNIADSHFDEYRIRLDKLNLSSVSDLENLTKPLIRPATRLKVKPSSRPPDNSQMKSHFGGQPYFEKGEYWPTNKTGKRLGFIFQIFNEPDLVLPENIKLVQFFYDWEAFPWDTESDGWLVKIYKTITPDSVKVLDGAEEMKQSKYCEVDFEMSMTLPDWEGISEYDDRASQLSCILNEDEPWEHYDLTVIKLIGEQNYQSQLGGYPRWVQGESTPKDSEGNPMRLLFQIDSEHNADLMWGDVGLVYAFYDEKYERVEFTLQCH